MSTPNGNAGTKIDGRRMVEGTNDKFLGKVLVEDGKWISYEELCKSTDEACRRFWNSRRRTI